MEINFADKDILSPYYKRKVPGFKIGFMAIVETVDGYLIYSLVSQRRYVFKHFENFKDAVWLVDGINLVFGEYLVLDNHFPRRSCFLARYQNRTTIKLSWFIELLEEREEKLITREIIKECLTRVERDYLKEFRIK